MERAGKFGHENEIALSDFFQPNLEILSMSLFFIKNMLQYAYNLRII
jgi:hypothetical protein